MNKVCKLLTLNALVFGGMILSSCGGNNASKTAAEVVTNFQINNETGAFSFTGVKEAKQYYVRVYNHVEYKVVDGEQVTDSQGKPIELGLEDKAFVAARRIRFKEGVTEYSGELDFGNLVAGNDYDAYVYTYVRDNAGDLVFAHTDATPFVFCKTYPTPEFHYTKVTTSSKGGTSSEEVYLLDNVEANPGELKITLGSNFFDANEDMSARDPNYRFTLYDANKQQVAQKLLEQKDIQTIENREENSKTGAVTITYERSATVTFSGNYDLDHFYLSVKVIATNTAAYHDSEESEITLLKDTIEAQEPGGGSKEGGEGQSGEGQQPGGEGQPGEGGFPGGEGGQPGEGGFPGDDSQEGE